MTHLSSINALASDIAKLSKTLSILAEEIESAHTQEDATEAATKKTKRAAQKEVTKKTGETSSLEDSRENVKSTLTVEAKPDVTIDEIRKVLAEKSQEGLTSKVKELLEKFGANKLSAVKEEDYNELFCAAKMLK